MSAGTVLYYFAGGERMVCSTKHSPREPQRAAGWVSVMGVVVNAPKAVGAQYRANAQRCDKIFN